jgi:hypothetical protein
MQLSKFIFLQCNEIDTNYISAYLLQDKTIHRGNLVYYLLESRDKYHNTF